MVAEQLIHRCSKLATTRLWHTTTLAEELKAEDAVRKYKSLAQVERAFRTLKVRAMQLLGLYPVNGN